MIKPADDTFAPFPLERKYNYQGPFSHAIPIAEHYGFRLVKPISSSSDIAVPESGPMPKMSVSPIFEERFSSLEHYINNQEELAYPALLCHTKKATNKDGYLNLDVYGVPDSFVETLLLKSAYEILRKEGYDNLLIELNSFGSEESCARFEGEVEKFVRKQLSKFDKDAQDKIKSSLFGIYEIDRDDNIELTESQQDILLHRPRPVAHLSEGCRTHLKQLLEHLEETGMSYVLNPMLFPQSGKHAETVYTIIDANTGQVVAYGERFSTQAKNHASKLASDLNPEEDLHCAAITINLQGGKKEKYSTANKEDVCKIYFAHSGAIAKRSTLQILSLLHDAELPCKHAVIKNTLREQLYHSERSGFPITLILGVKEVQDGTILVRNNITNRQKAVTVGRMCSYLKRTLKTLS